MAVSVLDSFALLVFVFGQKGHDKVAVRLEQAAADVPVLMAAANWAEVRYMIERKAGGDAWRSLRPKLSALPLTVVPIGLDLAEQAGALKASHAMSLADCCAAALAEAHRADLYTGDPEFRAVADRIRIVWL